MKITKEQIKETLKLVMNEEADYKVFFKKALEKAGKSIPSMSDDEKKAFFNKIDAAWDAKSEVKEGNAFGAAVVAAKEAGEDEFEVDGEKFKVEESHSDCGCGCGGVTEGGCNTKSVNEATDIYQLKKIQITKFAGKGEQMIQINAPKYQTAGDHLVMTTKEFMHVLKMAPLLLKQLKESVVTEDKDENKVSNRTVSTLEKGIQRILGTEVHHDINGNGAHEFYIDDAEFVIGVNDGKEKKVAYSFSIYDDGARKYLGKGTAADEKDLIKKVLSIAKKYKKQLLLTTESVVKEAIDFAGWVAIDHKGKRLEIKKSEAKDLYNAKLLAIKKLKVPKSKESMLAIKPAYNESISKSVNEAGVIVEGKTSASYKDPKTGKGYTLDYYPGKKRWELNIMKKNASIYSNAITTIKRDTLAEIQEWLDGYKIDSRWTKGLSESVNEAASKEAMGIAALTGTRGSAVEDFINKHELDGKKLFKSITKANLRGRLNFVSALAGKDGNPNQKLTIKLHKENFNEELSTELAFEVITFMERPVMETVMVDEFEKSDIVEMLVNEGINDVLTEGVKAEFNTLVETYNKK